MVERIVNPLPNLGGLRKKKDEIYQANKRYGS